MRRLLLLGVLVTIPFALTITSGTSQDCPDNIPHVTGTWTTLSYQMPVNPISATLLHTGEVLIVAGSENDANNNSSGSESYRSAVWDPTGTDLSSIHVSEIYYDVFCSGTAVLPHGRPLIIGGSSDYSFKGDKRSTMHDPATGNFNQSQSMADGRWYATATALPDGRVMALSGINSAGGFNTTTQIYNLTNAGPGWETAFANGFTPPLFPRNFLLPHNGKVFFTGQGSGDANSTGYMLDIATNSWSAAFPTTSNRDYASVVLLPLNPPSYSPRIVTFGGGTPGAMTTEYIDPESGSPQWNPGPLMSAHRRQLGATLLPSGGVLVEGGSTNDEQPDSQGKSADLYDSAGNSISSAGFATYSRLYHSTTLLLPDATVAVMGSNPGNRGSYQSAIEIYTPAYMYDANDRLITDRPVITGATSGIYGYNAPFTVNYSSTRPIAKAVLARPGSSTHAFDMEQRLIGLCGPSPQPSCNGSGGSITLTTPPNGNIAPPGYYMLFLLDTSGVPSKAQFIEISQYGTTPPDGVIATPAGDVTVTVGSNVNFTTNTTASKYSWIFPGGSTPTSTAKSPGNIKFNTPGEYAASLTVIDASGNSDPSPSVRVIHVIPTSGNFDIDVDPPAVEVHPGGSAQFTVTVTPLSGFTGSVALTVSSEGGFLPGTSSGGFSPSTITGGGGTSTLTIDTTTSAVPYALSLTIQGTSGTIVHTTSTTLLLTLETPSGLVATPGNSQVALSWQPTTGASGYQVQRSLVSGGPYESLGCPSGAAWTDTGLANGTTYYYAVLAQFTGGADAGGASPLSSEVSGTPSCPVPPYSGTLTASKSSGNTVWSWTTGGASAWDLVRGDLPTLRSTGGNFTAALNAIPASEPACLANDTSSTSKTDTNAAPAPGGGYFTIIRPVVTSGCPAAGTYNDGSATLVLSRDAGIAASGRACP